MVWPVTFESRLDSWTQLRTRANSLPVDQALDAINSWWFSSPWTGYHLHWDDREDWPDPWQLLDDNIFCDPNRGSRVSISSECGASYLIRLASVTATTGFATLHVTALSDQISCCVADLDGSGQVDSNDVALVLLDFGVCDGCATDQDGSGMVDSGDVALILLNSGDCP